ncbi:hypothetical protein HYPSUDRAFT_849483 [Hypholoma sublateritium FD-334 SS-4]|uniref:Mitochondrial import inner membrane translocase subunit TIM16 n=1 Tax=Hypholoma sublateritium (strain FD-334 SS-4) TaxID=945553 RepID=A0A0D2M9E9_HYPSF|nr:hypothetical protein HYPSUDRAFT_849483 [Hypholoma sublateritium FD-334 SS-4]
MSSPKVIVNILLTGTKILGKAFLEAGRQAVKNAKSSPAGVMGGDAAGVGHANSGSATDQLTRHHRMTLDEAQLILNVKRGDTLEQVMKNYEHLFKINSPPPPAPKPTTPGKQALTFHSHYLQSKVFRARERLQAEYKIPEAAADATATKGPTNPPGTPVDPPQSGTP